MNSVRQHLNDSKQCMVTMLNNTWYRVEPPEISVDTLIEDVSRYSYLTMDDAIGYAMSTGIWNAMVEHGAGVEVDGQRYLCGKPAYVYVELPDNHIWVVPNIVKGIKIVEEYNGEEHGDVAGDAS